VTPDAVGQRVLDAALARVAADPVPLRDAGLVPYFVSALGGGGATALGRVPLSWWGLVAGDDPAPALRDAYHTLLQGLYPERYLRFLGWESLALAGCDLYADALRDALRPPPPARARPAPLLVGVCGIDGAGKSSHVAALAAHLRERGLRVQVHKIYRHGVFHDTVTDLVRACAGDRHLHLWRVERMAKVFDSVKYWFTRLEPELASCDVVLFDRYVPTHLAAGAGRCHFDPGSTELLEPYPPADLLVLLDLPVAAALERLGERGARTMDENPYMLGRFAALLRALAEDGGMHVLDARAPFETNQARLRELVGACLRMRGAG